MLCTYVTVHREVNTEASPVWLPFDTRVGNREGSRLEFTAQSSVVEVSGLVDCPLVRSVLKLQRLG
jgi:hypothetical protein